MISQETADKICIGVGVLAFIGIAINYWPYAVGFYRAGILPLAGVVLLALFFSWGCAVVAGWVVYALADGLSGSGEFRGRSGDGY